tara:strand:+ start:578 stop:1507 length:930 start_codon:yes stop_codon:yes gene_type:complete
VEDKYAKQIGALDWLIFFSIILMVVMVYTPLSVWDEENHYRNLRRERMRYIADAEEFYYELTGEYTKEINKLFPLVEAAMDSLIADSTFFGKDLKINLKINQNGNIKDTVFSVTMDESFSTRVDTTFSKPDVSVMVVTDVLYKIGLRNEQNFSLIDTLWVNDKNFRNYESSSNYLGKYVTHYEDDQGNIVEIDDFLKDTNKYIANNYIPKKVKFVKRTEKRVNYIRRKFHLSESMIYCPISKNNNCIECDFNSNEKFVLDIDKTKPSQPTFSIESSVDEEDKEWRYGIFRYNPGKKESIVAGVQSWAGE